MLEKQSLADASELMVQLTGLVLVLGIYFATLVLVARPWVQTALSDDRIGCHRCDYHLMGNVSGVCPECGTAIASAIRPRSRFLGARLKGLPWQRIGPVAGVLTIVAAILLGYIRTLDLYVCADCGRHQFRRTHIFAIPFGGPWIIDFDGAVYAAPRGDVLVRFLDPDGQCTHRWCGRGWDGAGWTCGWRGISADDASPWIAAQPDFARFIDRHPQYVDRMRTTLQERSDWDWLTEAYFEGADRGGPP